jgi:hypothetical protein
MNRPDPSSSLSRAANVLQNSPEQKLLALALLIAQEIPNEHPAEKTPSSSLSGSKLSRSHGMYRAKAFAAVGSALLETANGNDQLVSIGRALVMETINFVSRHVQAIDFSDMSELLVPIAVASHRAQCQDLLERCIVLGELIVEKIEDPEAPVSVGMSPFWRLAYRLAEQGDLTGADRVLENLMISSARGKALTHMIVKLQADEVGKLDKRLISYVMTRSQRCFRDLVELSQEDSPLVKTIGDLAYALSSLYASHRMVGDISELLKMLPTQVDVGVFYGVAVATSLNLAKHTSSPDKDAERWLGLIEEFSSCIRDEDEVRRYHMRSSFALELAVRVGDVRDVLWPENQTGKQESSGRKAKRIDTSDRFDRYLAKLIAYSNVGGKPFEELLNKFPRYLERIIDEDSDVSGGEIVSHTIRWVTRGVVVHDRQEAIFRQVVGACRNLAHAPMAEAEDDSPSLHWVEYDDTYIVESVELLLKAGYRDIAYDLFSLIPEKSDLGYYAVAAFATNAASSADPRYPETLTAAEELYEEACKKVLVVASDPSAQRNKATKKEVSAATREAVGNLWTIGARAAAHCCDGAAQKAFLRAHELTKKISPKSSPRFLLSLVENISDGYIAGWTRRREGGQES